MLKILTVTMLLVCTFAVLGSAQNDWDGIPIPVGPPDGMDWELQTVSDSFNYQSTWDNRPVEFTDRWEDWFINPWSGPSITQWERGHVWTNGSELGIQAHHDPNSNNIFMGCMSSHDTFQYPFFMEARVRLSDCVLANNIWMLSADSEEEIDMIETYPSSRSSQAWFDARMHLSHHVFIRDPFQDYQPRDEEDVFGTWHWQSGRSDWRDEWVRVGVYWKDPWHLEYFINGSWVRTIKSFEHSYLNGAGQNSQHTTNFNAIDKFNFTSGTGLSKPMHIIINLEQQSWRTDGGVIPTAAELTDANGQNIYFVDWIRVYEGVETTQSETVAANAFVGLRGVHVGGSANDVAASDDAYLEFQPGFTLNSSEAPVWLVFEADLSEDSPTALEFVIETNSNTPGLTQTTEVFNWTTNQFQQVSVESSSFSTDSVVTIDLSAQADSYVLSNLATVRTRTGWRQTGFTLLFPWQISTDYVAWNASY